MITQSLFRGTLRAFLGVVLLTWTMSLTGRHIVGGEVYYVCQGPGSIPDSRDFRITMNIYRDCAGGGAGFDRPAKIGVYTYINGVYAFVRQMNVNHGAVEDLESSSSPCLTLPPNVCVEQSAYSFNLVNLPLIQGSYIVAWQRCCRNNTINNIVAPHNTGATYMVEILEEAQRTCNDSPTFDEFPPIGICINEPIVFDHSATDPEGDQIVYEFCAPIQGGGPAGVDFGDPESCEGIWPDPSDCPPPYPEVIFRAPNYSSANPLGTTSLISLNPSTGQLTGTPRVLGQFVVGVCVKEYRNGELLSVLRRDFQFNVVTCQSNVDAKIQADAVVNNKEFVLNSCGNNTITFRNESVSEQFIDSYRWTFTIGGQPVERFTRHATFTFPGVGQYQGRMIINEGQLCGDTAFINVNIFPTIETDFEFTYDTCIGGPVNFRDKSVTAAQQLTDWEWDFGDSESSKVRNPNHLYQIPGLHPVQLIATDNNNCKDTMTRDVSYFPVPPLILIKPTKYSACVPEHIKFTNLSVPIDETYDIQWDFGDGGTGDDISPTHEFTDEGTFDVKVSITSPIGCYTEETFPNLITMEPSPVAGFSMTPDVINSIQSTASFSDLSQGGTGWFWNFGGEGSSFIRNPTFTFQDTGVHEILQVVFHPNGCSDTAIQILDIEPIVQYFLPNAFTPNYDGKNEVYKPEGLSEGVAFYEMSIYSRWGDLIYQTNDPEDGWNGRRNNAGQEMPVGVYLCVLEYKDARNRDKELREFVTLVR